jgi:hypothetical protein
MNVSDYITQKFQTFGITMSEAELLDISISSGLNEGDEVDSESHSKLNVAIARFIPTLFLRATSVSENGFSMSWDVNGLKAYYSYLCNHYGLKYEMNTDKPKVKFL